MLYFSVKEYRERIRKTKKRMEEAEIEVLLISDPGNMNYLTGYDAWSFFVHQCIIIFLDQDEPIWIGRAGDAGAARLTTFLKEENIREYTGEYFQSKTMHPMMVVAEVIKEKGWERKILGLEMDQCYFTHRSFIELEKALPGAVFKDGNLLVNMVRRIKSENEIRFMKIAGLIAVNVMKTAIDKVDVGIRECDVAAVIAQAQYQGIPEYGGDYPAIVPLIMVGKRTMTPHLTWTERKIQKDEPIIMELSGVYKHYHAQIARTIFIGTPPPLLAKSADILIEGLVKALEIIKPGLTCEEVHKRWLQVISEPPKLFEKSRIGYSVGLSYPPDWGDQTMNLQPGDKTVLKPNMTFHIIPGIWQEDVGFEVDATIRITENGCETLYEFPYELFKK